MWRLDGMDNMNHQSTTRDVLALSQVHGIGPAFFAKNLGRVKLAINDGGYDSFSDLFGDKITRSDWQNILDKTDTTLEQYENLGIKALSIFDSAYPKKLLETRKPPPVLFCRGNIELLNRKTVSVIGARKPTRLGEIIAERVGAYFAVNDVSLCNGLADGVDAASIQTKGHFIEGTIGVLGSGLDFTEQKLNSKLLAKHALKVLDAGGLLVSEMMAGKKESTYSVVSSCRIQAGLANALFLIQSSIGGGSRFAVHAYCGLPRLLAYIDPPEQEKDHEEFSANAMLSQDGLEGLKVFAEVKNVGLTKLFRVKSRDDYMHVLQ